MEKQVDKTSVIIEVFEDALKRVDDRIKDSGGPLMPRSAKLALSLIVMMEGNFIYDAIVKNIFKGKDIQ